MEIHELLDQARETFGARREYGEPYERNGVTVIPASAVRGGGGGGSGQAGDGGGGFGLTARPAGAWVIRGETVSWQPAVDPNRIVLGAELLAGLALLRGFRLGGRRPGRHRVRAHRSRRGAPVRRFVQGRKLRSRSRPRLHLPGSR